MSVRSGCWRRPKRFGRRKEGDAQYPVPASVFYPEIDVLADGRAAIGDDAAERELAEGRSMSLAEAIAYAMED